MRDKRKQHVIQRRVGAEEAQLANECERGREARRQRGVSRAERRRRGGEVVSGREVGREGRCLYAGVHDGQGGERRWTAWSFHLSILARIDTLKTPRTLTERRTESWQTTDVSLLVYTDKRGGERANRDGQARWGQEEGRRKAVTYGAGRRRARVAMRRSAGFEAASKYARKASDVHLPCF